MLGKDTRKPPKTQWLHLGRITPDHRHAADVLSARAEQEGFIVDRCELDRGVRPDKCGYHATDPGYKLIGEAKASEGPGDEEAVDRLRNYFLIAWRGISAKRKPWSGFAFVLAFTQIQDADTWENVLMELAGLVGFETPEFHREQHDDVMLLIWTYAV